MPDKMDPGIAGSIAGDFAGANRYGFQEPGGVSGSSGARHELANHPGYVVRYDMWDGKPYYVPVGSPRSKADVEALKKYDEAAYNAPMMEFDMGASPSAFDPDTGKQMNLGELQRLLVRRYPQQASNDWDVGGNLRQPVVPGQATVRTAQNLSADTPLPRPRMTPEPVKPKRQFILPQR